MIGPLVAVTSRAALYPIQAIIIIALVVSGAYFHLLDIARNPPTSSILNSPVVGNSAPVESTIWARKTEGGWKWTVDPISEIADDRHIHLAWGQIGVTESSSFASPISERISSQFQDATQSSIAACFLLDSADGESQCLVTRAIVPDSPSSVEIGVLLPEAFNSLESWHAFLKKMNVPGAELLAFEIQEIAARGGSAAGNLLWLIQTLGRTYSRTRELVKNAPTIDIIIMVIGYVTMHFTFVSLFLNMRTMGSKFWLGATVLCSSTFSFLLALATVNYLGWPINMVLMSEGLPFLVVTVGFEKPFMLTKAVLQGASSSSVSRPTKDNVTDAVREKGPIIIRDYLVEIAVLALGAVSGVRGLRQFCFLAAWILGWDCVLLFTFYTAILSIKLEVNRIKRHTSIRKTLQEEGMSYRSAESVAAANDRDIKSTSRSYSDNKSHTTFLNLFGPKIKDSTVTRFKLFMVSSFVLLNLLNLCTLPFRPRQPTNNWTNPFNLTEQPSEATLNLIANSISSTNPYIRSITLSIFPPVFFQSLPVEAQGLLERSEHAVGGFLEGWTRSIGDPVISKWIVVVLCMSMGLNAWLLNAARHGAMQPIYSSTTKSSMPEIVVDQPSKGLNMVPASSGAEGKGAAKVNTFVLNDSESDDEEKHMSVVKSHNRRVRSVSECMQIITEGRPQELLDEEVVALVLQKKIPLYALEKSLKDLERAVKVRRAVVSRESTTTSLETSGLPYKRYDYGRVMGACCENVIGYVPIPVGVAGPCIIDGEEYWLPMATTEGCLVASTMRGTKAMNAGGGVSTTLLQDAMTRGPCVKFPTVLRAGSAKRWLDSEEGFRLVKKAFDSTSRFARLQSIKTNMAGNRLFIRFAAFTGDGMGMNMISKGVEYALSVITDEGGFGDMEIVSISGNFCTDKKPAAVNWIEGRGKSVCAEAFVPAKVVRSVLKSSVDEMIQLNMEKNLIGSAVAGSIGGFNAHAANLVTAVFLATGQDPAQNVESSNCMTLMDRTADGDLHISVTMPSVEVGTIGGGTILEPQAAMLDMLGVRGPHPTSPGANAQKLARIVAAAVLAGELSLCAALAAGHLVKSHMVHNRSTVNTPMASRSTTPMPTLTETAHTDIKPLTRSMATTENPHLGSCIKS